MTSYTTRQDLLLLFFFFFSSRRRHTRLQGDWSSDVCSSDLLISAPLSTRLLVPLSLPSRTAPLLRSLWDVRSAHQLGMPSGIRPDSSPTRHAAAISVFTDLAKTEIGRASCRERV